MLTIGGLANIKHILQQELFNASNEKILSICTVTKTYKKKKACYLCLVAPITTTAITGAGAGGTGTGITIYQIKQIDREKEYKKKRNWSLYDVKLVDGKNENSKTHEFDIQFDKTFFKWYAINLHERQNFITILYKNINKYVVNEKPEFKNIPSTWIQEKSPERILPSSKNGNYANNTKIRKDVEESTDEENEDFHILTEKEIVELNRLVEESEFAIKDAENFIDELSHKLNDLDGANIQSVLASEQKVFRLMVEIEKAISEAEGFEKRLDCYDDILGHVRETMEKIGGKNAMIETANNNNIKLMTELNKVITQFDLPNSYQLCLSEPDLKTNTGRQIAIDAGKALQKAMNGNIDPALLRLTAIQDQTKRFEKLKSKFSYAITRYLNNLFIHLGNDLGDSIPQHLTELSLPDHTSVHKELAVYTELMHWTKDMDQKSYDGLTKVYTKSLSKIYERELKTFFNQARLNISSKSQQSREDLDSSVASVSKSKLSSAKNLLVPYGTLGVNKELWSNSVENEEREKFDETLEKVLAELEPVALKEQMFCINFFQLDAKNIENNVEIVEHGQLPDTTNEIDRLSLKKNVKQINEEVRNMMVALFAVLESELLTFIQSLEKLDSFYSLYVLVRLTQHVMTAEDTHSFLSMTFASALVQVKRNLDRFMKLQLQSIEEFKVPKRSKCGILPYVENFEEFAKTAEEIFRTSDRRADMDKWYIIIVNKIFELIPIHGNEHSKTPIQVVKMENFHHMYALLAQLKIPVLETLKKTAKTCYNEALKSYVTKYFGRPLEKLNLFFDGVQQKVGQGVKETEISYQMAFSKQELRKVISQYPAREVKKGLDNLYKKVEKHLCEEENLLQVVWHAMQEEFIAQYNYLEERIHKCYAGAMINLEFTIHDILTFFSDIARSH